MQIIHTLGNHWIVASSIGQKNEVLVFDSLYCDIDAPTKCVIMEIVEQEWTSGRDNLQSKKELKIVAYLL